MLDRSVLNRPVWGKVFLFSLSIGLAFFACLSASEIFFFDKFYYKKSAKYGYLENQSNPLKDSHNPGDVDKRIADLRFIFSEQGQVLGVTQEKEHPYVVLLIGDSVVYGLGIKVEDRFANILEKKLNQYRPTKVYVLAQSGDSIVENYYKFQQAEQVIYPDITIFGLVDNDLILDLKYPGEDFFYKELRVKCPQEEVKPLWDDKTITTDEERFTKMFLPAFEPTKANSCYLNYILNKLKDKKVAFFPFYPLPKEMTDDRKQDKDAVLMYKYKSAIDQAGIKIINPTNIDGYVVERVSEKEVHPSKRMNENFSLSIEKELLENPKWGFAQ